MLRLSVILWCVCCSVFQEMEHEKFAALESKARSDKNVMMARLLHAAYVGVSESLCDAMVESPVGSLVPVGPLAAGIMISCFFVTLNCFTERSACSLHMILSIMCKLFSLWVVGLRRFVTLLLCVISYGV